MQKLQGVGVAFCGGGFKSYAQVAALEAMEKNNVKIAACAGTSAGSVVATLTAAGLDAATVRDLLLDADQRFVDSGILRYMRYHIFGLMTSSGLINSEQMLEQAQKTLDVAGIKGFGDIKMPLAIPAIDLKNGDLTVFTNAPEVFRDPQGRWQCLSGDLDLAACITASSAYPLAISPMKYLEHYYIDGGCRMNLPTPLFNRDIVGHVVGVGMHAKLDVLEPSEFGTLSIVNRAISCAGEQLDMIHAQMADLYINLPVSGTNAFDSGNGLGTIQEARIQIASNPPDWSLVKDKSLEASGIAERLISWFKNQNQA